jgi:FAD/FMN-containing dehydrogenase
MAATANARNVIGEATLGELEATLRGRLVRPSDPDYDQARAVWNAAHDRHPALIIRCAGTADVMRAVEFARSEGLEVAVRGGAHSIAGFSTSDAGSSSTPRRCRASGSIRPAGGPSPSPG